MKDDLGLLIEHLQREVDHLKSSMDQCVSQWDFDGAKAYREPLIYTQRKLTILKSLQNPNYNKISYLTGKISRLEKSLSEKVFDTTRLDEATRHRMEVRFNESTKEKIAATKIELEELKSIVPRQNIDNDRLFELLELLQSNKINRLDFEIKKDDIYLCLQVNNENAEFQFKTISNENIDQFLITPAKSKLVNLGFDLESYKKQLPNFKRTDKLKIVEELAIIYLEVFGIFDEEIRVEVN